MDRSEQLDWLVRRIVEEVRPLKVVLFGSSARAEAAPESDFDLLLVMPDGTHRRHTAQHLYKAIRGATIPFDLVVATSSDLELYGNAPVLIYRSALTEGRTLYAA